MKKVIPVLIYSLVLVLVTALISSGVTLMVSASVRINGGENATISQEDFSTLQRYKKLNSIMGYIQDAYYFEDVTTEDLVEYAAVGMVAMLGDPYSAYLSADNMLAYEESNTGEYVGIGAIFSMDASGKGLIATRIYPDSPASEGGLQVGDILYAVDGVNVTQMAFEDVTALVLGEEGTSFDMTVLRGENTLDVQMTRRKVEKVDVEYEMLEDGILQITLSAFSTNADKAFKEALKLGKEKNYTGIFLDLRGNGGGYDNILEEIADPLLPEGLIYYIEDKHGNREEVKSDAYKTGIPMVVLCDGMSASASEILIAAIQDYRVGTVVGTKTFGKGVGQMTFPIDLDGSGVKMTCTKAFSPLGRSWHGEGIEPDVLIEQPEELVSNPLLRTDENDVQRLEGLKLLRDMMAP